MKYLIIVSMLLTALNINDLSYIQDQNANDRSKVLEIQLEEKVRKILVKHNIPAVSIAIIKDGEFIMTKGIGVKDRNSGDLVNKKSMYQIGSLSKMLTGIIANNLILSGQLKLESSVLDYLPKDLNKKAKAQLKEVTVYQILHHVSGIRRTSKVVRRIDGNPMIGGYSEADIIEDLNRTRLKSKPGSTFRYSNLGYAIVGYICEKASGMTYNELFQKYISDEYQLENTCTLPNSNQNDLVVQPYRKDKPNVATRPWEMGKLIPAGGIYSNAEDLSKLMLAQLKAYKKYAQDGIVTPLILTKEGFQTEENQYYGYGLFKDARGKNTLFSHGGDLDGYASSYLFSPENQEGILFLTSCGGKWGQELMQELTPLLTLNK